MTSIWQFLVIFLYIFGWRLFGFIDLIQIVSLLFCGYAVFSREFWRVKARFSRLFISFVLVLIYALSLELLTGSRDIVVILRVVRAAMTLLGGIGIAIWLKVNRPADWRKFGVLSIFWAIFLHGTIMLVMYFSREFRLSVYSITGGPIYVNQGTFLGVSELDPGMRILGLTCGLSGTSMVQIAGVAIVPFFLRYSDVRLKVLTAVFASSVFVLSAATAGRSGLLIGGALLGPYFLLAYLLGPREFPRAKTVAVVSIIGVVGVIGFGIAAASGDARISYTLWHISELTLFVSGESPLSSTLSSMYFLPDEFTDFVFGTGTLGRVDGYNIPSDVGYVLQWFAYGMVGLILLWLPMIIMIKLSFLYRSKNILLFSCFAFTVIAAVIFNGKEEAVYERCFWSIQCMLFALLLSHDTVRARSVSNITNRIG